ncbi:major facilitator superfamily domain-containing protein [Catenaria anguillulae PL171]|uniref:Major facilitator superfamily domain-containing protein n=1 Tax=Catenaria anguillulae PL171 TaxID=765915 RepID=A0A1Y2HKY5_9FUNG|nr:major facilitator superfamily domain-containing protein [Catenaria anguillulae PL171]
MSTSSESTATGPVARGSHPPDSELAATDPARFERRQRRRKAYISLVVPFTLAISFSMIGAPQSQFLLRHICREVFNREEQASSSAAVVTARSWISPVMGVGVLEPPMAYCQQPDVQRIITWTTTVLGLCSTIPSLLVTSINGRLSDNPRIGRKPFMLTPIVAELINIFVLVLVAKLQLASSFLAIGYFFMGWSGGFSTFMMAYYALVSEYVAAARRTYFFTLVEASILSGMTLGPLLMSTIVHTFPVDPLAIFYASAVVQALTAALIMVLIDGRPVSSVTATRGEEQASDRATGAQETNRGIWAQLKKQVASFTIIWKPWNRTRLLLVMIFVLVSAGFTAHGVAFIPFTYRKFGWTAKEDGVFQAVSTFAKLLSIFAFLPVAYRRNRVKPAQSTPASGSSTGAETDPLLSETLIVEDYDGLRGEYSALRVGDDADDATEISDAGTIHLHPTRTSYSTPTSPRLPAKPHLRNYYLLDGSDTDSDIDDAGPSMSHLLGDRRRRSYADGTRSPGATPFRCHTPLISSAVSTPLLEATTMLPPPPLEVMHLPEASSSSSDHEAVFTAPGNVPAAASNKRGQPMEARVLRYAFLAYGVAFILFGLAPTGLMYLLASPLDAPGVLAFPLMRSMLTQTVPANMQGTLLGLSSTISSLSHIVCPILYTGLYASTVGVFDGAIYFVGATCWFVALVLSLFVQRSDILPLPVGELQG